MVNHEDGGEDIYEDESEGNTPDEALDAAWLSGAFTNLDNRWAARWDKLEKEVKLIKSKQAEEFMEVKQQQWTQTKQASEEIDKLSKIVEGEATKDTNRAAHVNQRLESLARSQQHLSANQNEQKKALTELRSGIIQDIQMKLEAATENMKNDHGRTAGRQNPHADTYAERAARPGRNEAQKDKAITSYFEMAKRTTTQRPAASMTDGTLESVYAKEWSKQLVGAVKRALRIAIGVWKQQNVMEVDEENDEEASPDIDAVRHLNQFGTPEAPLMEVACTRDRKETVIKFFKESNIEVWPDTINPLLAPDIEPDDDSQMAAKRHHGHSIRVLNAWWKAAHYVQNANTAAYYFILVTQVVRSSGSPYAWPKQAIGINIDARGVHTPKDNPKIDWEYEQGVTAPGDNENSKSRTVTVRSFATGGALPAAKAVKRLRPDKTTEDGTGEEARQDNQRGTPILTVEDIRTPAHTNARPTSAHCTPASSAVRQTAAGPSNVDSPPFRSITLDQLTSTPARPMTLNYGDANPPPPTPQTEGNAHIQMSNSGRKLPPHGPRAGSKVSGVEHHC